MAASPRLGRLSRSTSSSHSSEVSSPLSPPLPGLLEHDSDIENEYANAQEEDELVFYTAPISDDALFFERNDDEGDEESSATASTSTNVTGSASASPRVLGPPSSTSSGSLVVPGSAHSSLRQITANETLRKSAPRSQKSGAFTSIHASVPQVRTKLSLSSDGKRNKVAALRAFQDDVRFSEDHDLVKEVEDDFVGVEAREKFEEDGSDETDEEELKALTASSPAVIQGFTSIEAKAAQDATFAAAFAAAMAQIDHDLGLCEVVPAAVPLSHNYPWTSLTSERKSQLALDHRRLSTVIRRPSPSADDSATRPSPFARAPSASFSFPHGSPSTSPQKRNRPSTTMLSFRQKYQTQLQAVLRHPKASEALRVFMEKEHSEENLDFLVALSAFRKKYPSDTKEVSNGKLLAHAAKLYEQFVAANGPSVVNLPSAVAEQLTAVFSKQETFSSGINQWIFNEAQEHVFTLVCQDTFWRFFEDPENSHWVEKALEKTKPST